MGYFQVRYDSRVVIDNRRAFIRLATANKLTILYSHYITLKVNSTFK